MSISRNSAQTRLPFEPFRLSADCELAVPSQKLWHWHIEAMNIENSPTAFLLKFTRPASPTRHSSVLNHDFNRILLDRLLNYLNCHDTPCNFDLQRPKFELKLQQFDPQDNYNVSPAWYDNLHDSEWILKTKKWNHTVVHSPYFNTQVQDVGQD